MIDKLRYQELEHRMERLKQVKRQALTSKKLKNVSHVVYVMETVKVCGGVKIILQHAERLVKQGIRVTLVAHYPLPTWFVVEADYIQVPFGIELAAGIPECDLIIANYYKHIHSCIETGIAPVVYFEQGDFHLFQFDQLDSFTKAFVFRQFQLPNFILTVSSKAAEFIKRFFGRESEVIPIAVDQSIFNKKTDPYYWEKPYILMMGLEETFKCVEDIIQAMDILKSRGLDVDLLWITPEEPKKNQVVYKHVKKIFVNPPQKQIASLFRGARLFVSASQYESFSLPVLEAMSCDCPVVTTNNPGAMEYSKDRVNCLVSNINDVTDLSNKMEYLLLNEEFSSRIRMNGLETAQEFSWEQTLQRLITYYNHCSSHTVNSKSYIDDWEINFSCEELVQPNEYEKLLTMILNCNEDIVQIPHIHRLMDGIEIARWETVAVRKVKSNNSTVKFIVYAYGKDTPSLLYKDAYDHFKLGNYSVAMDLFSKQCMNQQEMKTKAIYAKWMIFCLIGMGKHSDGVKLVEDFLEIYEDFMDLYYLLNLIYFIDHGTTKQEYDNIINVIGEATGYPEFIYLK